MNSLIPVPFRNANLLLADVDGTPYVPMRPVVEGMGLSWAAQTVKLNSNKVRWGVSIIETPADPQPMLCIPLRKLPGWLMTIQPSRVKPEARESVEAFQNECDDVLWDYWAKGQAINPRSQATAVLPQDYPAALRALADEHERRQQAERELAASRPKIAFHDQVVSAETLIDFTQAFSLLQRRTGQSFTRRTFLEFMRRHGVACQPNRHANIGRDRFVPRKDYTGTWFVSEISQTGEVEWMLRPLAIAGIVQLIEQDRMNAPISTIKMITNRVN